MRSVVLLAILAAGTVQADVNKWTNAGPANWAAAFVVFDPQDPDTVYSGTAVGLFKSQDGGVNWDNAGLIGWSLSSLIIDPQNPSTLYAVTASYADDDFDTIRVFKSTDSGATWNEADSGLPTQYLIELAPISAQNNAALYALAGEFPRTLFKSTDGGANWAPAGGLPGSPYFVGVAVDPQDSSTLYAATQGAAAGHPVAGCVQEHEWGSKLERVGLRAASRGKRHDSLRAFWAARDRPQKPEHGIRNEVRHRCLQEHGWRRKLARGELRAAEPGGRL